MHVPSWPSEIQWNGAAGGRAAASASSGKASSLSATTVTSWPGAARGVEDEKREPAVAGDQAEAHRWRLLVRDHFLGAPRWRAAG